MSPDSLLGDDRPSQARTRASTSTSWADVSLPTRRSSFREWDRNEALRVECAGAEKRNGEGNLELRTAKAGCVRNEGHEGTIGTARRHAQDNGGAHFRGKPQID